MPKASPKLKIKLDLLKPQSSPEKIHIKLIRWLLSSGRYIFVFVEAIVLLAFLTRFKLDADLAEKKEAIEQQIPYIESLRQDEILIRQTQAKLSAIDAFLTSSPPYPQILKDIAQKTPQGVRLVSLNLEKNVNTLNIQITGHAQTNFDLANFLAGLKNIQYLGNIVLTNVGLEQGVIRFTITGNAGSLGESL